MPTLTCFLAFLFPLCLHAEPHFCYFCISSVKFPHQSHTSFPHSPGCHWRTQQSQEHCQAGTVRNIFPTLAESQPLWRAAEQAFYCCLQFNTQLYEPLLQLNTTWQVNTKQEMCGQWTWLCLLDNLLNQTCLPALWVEKGELACRIALGKWKRTGRRI